MLSDFAKVFERKVWRVQVAHLHNAARALSRPSRCFQLTTNLGKISFVIFDIVIKNKSNVVYRGTGEIPLIGINWHVFIQSECRNCCLYVIRKSRHKQNLENISKYGFSPDLGGKNGGVLSMRMQVILDSSFARPGSARCVYLSSIRFSFNNENWKLKLISVYLDWFHLKPNVKKKNENWNKHFWSFNVTKIAVKRLYF